MNFSIYNSANSEFTNFVSENTSNLQIKNISRSTDVKDVLVWDSIISEWVWRVKLIDNNSTGPCSTGYTDCSTGYVDCSTGPCSTGYCTSGHPE